MDPLSDFYVIKGVLFAVIGGCTDTAEIAVRVTLFYYLRHSEALTLFRPSHSLSLLSGLSSTKLLRLNNWPHICSCLIIAPPLLNVVATFLIMSGSLCFSSLLVFCNSSVAFSMLLTVLSKECVLAPFRVTAAPAPPREDWD